jgi:hypothetical protein
LLFGDYNPYMTTPARSLGAHHFRKDLHWIPKRCSWLESVRRGLRMRGITHAERLFVYIHRETGATMLAWWVKERPGGIGRAFVTLTDLVCLPDLCPAAMPSMAYLVARVRPAREQAKGAIAAMREEEYLEREEARRQDEAKAEYLKWVKKKNPELHRLVERGIIPISFDHNPGLEEAFARAASSAEKKASIIKGS